MDVFVLVFAAVFIAGFVVRAVYRAAMTTPCPHCRTRVHVKADTCPSCGQHVAAIR